MPGLQQSQYQSLELRQKLAPQMQQSLALLQATTMELNQMVDKELAENPTLEEESTDISVEEQKLDRDAEDVDAEFNELSQLDEEWREYMSQSRANAPRRDDDQERRQHMMDSLVEVETLADHLLEQLSTADAPDDIRELAETLIGNIDEHGFLTQSIEDMSLDGGLPFPKLKRALELVQSFHPVGVGAHDLRECLLLQLQHIGKKHSLEYRVIDNHLDDLARKRYPQIAHKLSVSPEQITEAAESISELEPRPGRPFSQGTNHYVTAEVFVTRDEDGDGYTVSVNNDYVPHLRISNVYKDIMAGGGKSSEEAKEYIREKIRSGKFLIRCIQQRQDTIRRIGEEIVKRQRDFFDKGISHLHPMNMAQVAKVAGVHETTVSRAVSGKYMATPRGVFEMKYFFKPGYETDDGESLANTSVKQAVADIVAEEDARKPLSDDKIVKGLADKGIKIARRTVAKYRDELGILPSHLRRSY